MSAGRGELGAPRKSGGRSRVELVACPGVHHGFDNLGTSLVPTPGTTFKVHRVEFHEDATRNAIVAVRDFLRRAIGVQELNEGLSGVHWIESLFRSSSRLPPRPHRPWRPDARVCAGGGVPRP